ncbi:MAG: hypothetical protein AAF741_02065 [Bacteroidota bacterium]
MSSHLLKNQSWLGTLFGLAFIALVIGLTVELNQMSRSLDARELAILCVKVSIAMTFLAGLIIWDRKQWSSANRYKTMALALLGCMMLGTWATLLANRLGTHLRKSKIAQVEVVKEDAYYQGGVVISPDQASGKPDRYLSIFKWRGKTYELSLDEPLFSRKEAGDTVALEIQTGLFGYRYVKP